MTVATSVNTVMAPSWANRAERVRLHAPKHLLAKFVHRGWSWMLAEYAGLIREEFDPEIGGLSRAHSLWRGLNCPLDEHDNDRNTLVYIMDPMHSYIYEGNFGPDPPMPNHKVKGCAFAVFVRPGKGLDPADPHSEGLVTFWQWLPAKLVDGLLQPVFNPEDDGYHERVW